MKTLEELKEGIRNLQALAEDMQGDISEVIRAGEEKDRDRAEDLTSLMHEAERHPVKPHPLDQERCGGRGLPYAPALGSVIQHLVRSEGEPCGLSLQDCRGAAA